MDDPKYQRKRREEADRVRESYHTNTQRIRKNFSELRDQNDFLPAGPGAPSTLGRMSFYLSLTDISLGPYVNLAYQKARDAYAQGKRHWTNHFTSGVADISIQLLGRKCFVKITSVDSFYCEFATSGFPAHFGAVSGLTTNAYDGFVVGVDVSVKNGATRAVSHLNTYQGKIARSQTSEEFESKNKRAAQVQLICEPVQYPQGTYQFNRWTYPVALMQTYAPGNPHTGYPTRGSLRGANRDVAMIQQNPGPLGHFMYRDIGFDVPYADAHGTDDVRYAYIRGSADWPRAQGLQQVDSAYGKREYAIYVDASNNFMVFPTDQIDPLGIPTNTQNVDETYVRRVTPTLPAWCYVPPEPWITYYGVPPNPGFITSALIDGPELHWHFNHLGTKACTIAIERSEYNYDTAFWATGASGTPFTLTDFNLVRDDMGVGSRNNTAAGIGYNDQRYFTAPGMLEATVTITITGPDPEDFTASVAVTEIQRPNVACPCSILCGYVWYDIYADDHKTKIVSAGDFLSLDIEGWHNSTNASDHTAAQVIMVLRDVRASKEVLTWIGMPVLAADFTTCSFVFKAQELEFAAIRNFPKKTGLTGTIDTEMFKYSFGAAVFSQGKFAELMFPDTLPGDKRAALEAIVALDGRQYMNDLIVADGTWAKIPLYNPQDGWSDTDINGVRHHYANLWGFTTGGAADLPSFADTNFLMFTQWRPDVGEPAHLLYCDNPRWGWHYYASALASYMHMQQADTFWTHPNGTWCYFSNFQIYNPNDVVNGRGSTNNEANSLDSFDVSQLEHVVFDRVHFELQANNKRIGKHDTTFVDLYNKAIRTAINSGKAPAGASEILPAGLRATFTKGVTTLTGAWAGTTYLTLGASWDGASYTFDETAVQGGTYNGTPLPQQGSMVGFGFASPWVDSGSYVAFPYSVDPHVRFSGIMIATKPLLNK